MDFAATDAGDGLAFLVAAGVVYEAVAAACSSPQTTEINAGSRADTLMKWVHLGLGQAAILIGVAVAIQPQRAKATLAGATMAGGMMYLSYIHAKNAGLASGQPGTES